MSEFTDVGYWWRGGDSDVAHGPPGRMHARSLPEVLPCDDLQGPPKDWRKGYRLIIVHHFPRTAGSVQAIKRHHPDAKVAIRLDRAPEVTGRRAMIEHWPHMLRDMKQADYIADAMPDLRHARYWAQMTGTRAVALPSPILPHPDLEQMRTQPREQLIVCLDHKSEPRFPAPTLAAAKYVQDRTDCRVVMIAARDQYIKQLARDIGVRVEFVEVEHAGMLAWLARAKVYLDLYTMHTPGRINVLAAWLGTPSVGSWNSPVMGHPRVDPWSADGGLVALRLMRNSQRCWDFARAQGIELVDSMYHPDRIRDAVRAMMVSEVGV